MRYILFVLSLLLVSPSVHAESFTETLIMDGSHPAGILNFGTPIVNHVGQVAFIALDLVTSTYTLYVSTPFGQPAGVTMIDFVRQRTGIGQQYSGQMALVSLDDTGLVTYNKWRDAFYPCNDGNLGSLRCPTAQQPGIDTFTRLMSPGADTVTDSYGTLISRGDSYPSLYRLDPIHAVPEPATGVLLLTGLMVGVWRRHANSLDRR